MFSPLNSSLSFCLFVATLITFFSVVLTVSRGTNHTLFRLSVCPFVMLLVLFYHWRNQLYSMIPCSFLKQSSFVLFHLKFINPDFIIWLESWDHCKSLSAQPWACSSAWRASASSGLLLHRLEWCPQGMNGVYYCGVQSSLGARLPTLCSCYLETPWRWFFSVP